MTVARIVHKHHVGRFRRIPAAFFTERVDPGAQDLGRALQREPQSRSTVDKRLRMIGNRLDVGVTGDRPERLDVVAFVPVHRRLVAQQIPRRPRVNTWMVDIQRLKRQAHGISVSGNRKWNYCINRGRHR